MLYVVYYLLFQLSISDITSDESIQLVSLTQQRLVNAQTETAGLNTEKTSRCSNTKCQNEITVLRHMLEQLQLSEVRLLRYTRRRYACVNDKLEKLRAQYETGQLRTSKLLRRCARLPLPRGKLPTPTQTNEQSQT